MKIETEPIVFDINKLSKIGFSSLQKNYLEVLLKEKTIEKTFFFYLKQGWLISFEEFFQLLFVSLKEQAILNKNFHQYFKNYLLDNDSFLNTYFQKNEACYQKQKNTSFALNEFPFFRNLDPQIVNLMQSHSQLINVPAHCIVLRNGQNSRDLYVIQEGLACVYKSDSKGRKKVADLYPQSLFGEAGFFWGSPRSADVVTLAPTQLIKIEYKAELFDKLVNQPTAQKLQTRLWALNALMKSEFFKYIPSDSIDELILSGKTVQAPAGTLLFNENQPGSSFFIIIQGQVSFYKNSVRISTLGQGDSFGEISLFFSAGKRTASAKCDNDCSLIEINQSEFFKIISRNLILAREIELQARDRLHQDLQRSQKKSVA